VIIGEEVIGEVIRGSGTRIWLGNTSNVPETMVEKVPKRTNRASYAVKGARGQLGCHFLRSFIPAG
jgi:hypothetical protein